MALTKQQRFFGSVIPFLIENQEDFRIVFEGKEYKSIGGKLYCDGQPTEYFYVSTCGN